MLAAVKAFVEDSGNYAVKLDAKASDILMGRIASLLDEVKSSLVENELQDIKKEIIDELSGSSVSSLLRTVLAN